MVFTLLFSAVLSIFGSIVNIVVPALPSAITTILDYVLDKIALGLNYVWIFVPKNLVMQCFNWWIVLFGLLLTIELFLQIWRIITGNVSSSEATSETTVIDNDTGEVLASSTKTRRTHSRRILPRF